jgi:chromosome segregation ATPase
MRLQAQLSLLQTQLAAAQGELGQLQGLLSHKEAQIDDLKEALRDLAQLEAAQQQAQQQAADSTAAVVELQQQLDAAREELASAVSWASPAHTCWVLGFAVDVVAACQLETGVHACC